MQVLSCHVRRGEQVIEGDEFFQEVPATIRGMRRK